jgi:hypothetical protein
LIASVARPIDAEIVAGDLGDRERNDQTEQAQDHGEDRLRYSILRDAAHELRSDPVADGEQEHQECERLEWPADRDAELADEHRGEQRRGHGPEAETLVGEGAEIVTGAQGQEDGDFRILPERLDEPVDHDVTSPCDLT